GRYADVARLGLDDCCRGHLGPGFDTARGRGPAGRNPGRTGLATLAHRSLFAGRLFFRTFRSAVGVLAAAAQATGCPGRARVAAGNGLRTLWLDARSREADWPAAGRGGRGRRLMVDELSRLPPGTRRGHHALGSSQYALRVSNPYGRRG